jgi:hypothetical protein
MVNKYRLYGDNFMGCDKPYQVDEGVEEVRRMMEP